MGVDLGGSGRVGQGGFGDDQVRRKGGTRVSFAVLAVAESNLSDE